MIHALITLGLCVVFTLLHWLVGVPAALCLLPGAWYCGREIAQAEYRYIEQYCNRKRANMPWYGALLPKAWTVKGMLDWILPSIVSIVFYIVNYYWVPVR